MTNNAIEPSEYSICRHFVAYSGVKLPLKLVNQLEQADMGHRNTFFRGYYDDQDRLLVCQKVVYGEIEFEHRYEYDELGSLQRAVITEANEEPKILRFDPKGKPMAE
jgi:hypothetical protein